MVIHHLDVKNNNNKTQAALKFLTRHSDCANANDTMYDIVDSPYKRIRMDSRKEEFTRYIFNVIYSILDFKKI